VKALVLACVVVVAGCANKPAAHECASGIVCPDPLQCAAVQPVCISNSCGNGVIDPGETCDDGNITDGDGCAADCKSAEACGDGVRNTEAGEVCDDGNTINGDGCSADCKSLEQCGNGITDINEICDDGNTHNGTCGDSHVCDSNADCTVGVCTPDGCAADCKSNETCGNGIKDIGEVCDDGHAPGGCEDDCQHGVGCGNGVLDVGEECDDGNTVTTDDCTTGCTINVCGDHILDSTGTTHHETCDPGSGGVALETADCNIDCTTPSCGDGKVNLHYLPDGTHPEQCDLGTVATVNQNVDSGDCTASCQVNVCGDNNPDTTGTHLEGCDDGNRIDTDACRNDCIAATCGDGIVQIGTDACDDGNTNDLDACRNNCTYAFCGDGAQDNGEACDPTAPHVGTDNNGNTLCNSDCTVSACGDGKLNTHAGETCDDGNTSDTDGCLSSSSSPATKCKVAQCGDGKIFTNVEQCDTGNTTDTMGCYALKCTFSTCGDSHTNTVAGEECDEGALNGMPGHCNAFCHNPGCGNGQIDNGEVCDSGTGHPDTASCDSDCSAPVCGDGHTNALFMPDGTNVEQCDDGTANTNNTNCPYNMSCLDRCSTTCQIIHPHEPICGDGIIDAGHETCDDSGLTQTKADCGYPTMSPCLACHSCAIMALPPEFCGDGVKNGPETDLDCGGATCDGSGHKCADTKKCSIDLDCANGYCNQLVTPHVCATPACNDSAKNGSETDTDCGGATCDGLGDRCADTKSCLVGNDCLDGVCDGTNHCAAPLCNDAVRNGTETDLDCGGATCDTAGDRCADTKKCGVDNDCTNGYCNIGVSPHVCVTPTCTDLVQNEGETGIDCGGTSTCGGCPGTTCTLATDCHSLSCNAGGTCD
jgi:cysteine-rich repeat protein